MDDIRDVARRNLCLGQAMRDMGDEKAMLEAFMATFHPELQKDRQYMRKLHAAKRRGRDDREGYSKP